MATDRLLNVEIITPQKLAFSGTAKSVSLPGSLSPFQVLPSHAPIVSALDSGVLKLTDEKDKTHYFAVSVGFVEVKSDVVSILVEKAVPSSDINVIFAAELIDQAKQLLREAKREDEKEAAVSQIQFAEACIKISEKVK